MTDGEDMNYHGIGVVGLSSTVLLSLVVVFQTRRCMVQLEKIREKIPTNDTMALEAHSIAYYKKRNFHLLLYFAVITDLPLYAFFIISGQYEARAYAFHKFQTPLFFVTFSLTIKDWMQALVYLNQMYNVPIFLRNASLLAINFIIIVSSVASFFQLMIDNDLDSFASSSNYTINYILQVIAGLLLTAFMLHTGLMLWYNIEGAVGSESEEDEEEALGMFSNVDGSDDDMYAPVIKNSDHNYHHSHHYSLDKGLGLSKSNAHSNSVVSLNKLKVDALLNSGHSNNVSHNHARNNVSRSTGTGTGTRSDTTSNESGMLSKFRLNLGNGIMGLSYNFGWASKTNSDTNDSNISRISKDHQNVDRNYYYQDLKSQEEDNVRSSSTSHVNNRHLNAVNGLHQDDQKYTLRSHSVGWGSGVATKPPPIHSNGPSNDYGRMSRLGLPGYEGPHILRDGNALTLGANEFDSDDGSLHSNDPDLLSHTFSYPNAQSRSTSLGGSMSDRDRAMMEQCLLSPGSGLLSSPIHGQTQSTLIASSHYSSNNPNNYPVFPNMNKNTYSYDGARDRSSSMSAHADRDRTSTSSSVMRSGTRLSSEASHGGPGGITGGDGTNNKVHQISTIKEGDGDTDTGNGSDSNSNTNTNTNSNTNNNTPTRINMKSTTDIIETSDGIPISETENKAYLERNNTITSAAISDVVSESSQMLGYSDLEQSTFIGQSLENINSNNNNHTHNFPGQQEETSYKQSTNGNIESMMAFKVQQKKRQEERTELRRALRVLVVIMSMFFFTELSIAAIMMYSYMSGAYDEPDATLGPSWAQFTFQFWFPSWGAICCMLYLHRTQAHLRGTGGVSMTQGRGMSSNSESNIDPSLFSYLDGDVSKDNRNSHYNYSKDNYRVSSDERTQSNDQQHRYRDNSLSKQKYGYGYLSPTTAFIGKKSNRDYNFNYDQDKADLNEQLITDPLLANDHDESVAGIGVSMDQSLNHTNNASVMVVVGGSPSPATHGQMNTGKSNYLSPPIATIHNANYNNKSNDNHQKNNIQNNTIIISDTDAGNGLVTNTSTVYPNVLSNSTLDDDVKLDHTTDMITVDIVDNHNLIMHPENNGIDIDSNGDSNGNDRQRLSSVSLTSDLSQNKRQNQSFVSTITTGSNGEGQSHNQKHHNKNIASFYRNNEHANSNNSVLNHTNNAKDVDDGGASAISSNAASDYSVDLVLDETST